MKIVIKIVVFSLLAINVSLAQDEVMLAQGSFNNLKIKGVPLEELYEMDKNFEGLKVFGKPIKVDSVYMSAEPKWIYHYPGFVLTFVQFFPSGPELLTVEVTKEEADFSYSDINLFKNSRESLRGSFTNLHFKAIPSKLTDNEKFGEGHRYLEYHYSSNKLNKIIYKIDPNL
ncbi:hypothetical protein JKA74_10480 [Marivirga sp. S37H4]|uniref:Uncharacterized protein n=1 Tax=Marivirga aurantiaca TaxID=2802615 RepID=A0A934WYE8_9BACT|nr:hypothetical protein [Marivirga aurantiaca]MBK6265463.1 hypothetical protein [Marivirga aurantiaca]